MTLAPRASQVRKGKLMETAGRTPRKPMQRNDPEPENESLQIVEQESADIERDVPEIENEPIERNGRQDKPDPPIFEE